MVCSTVLVNSHTIIVHKSIFEGIFTPNITVSHIHATLSLYMIILHISSTHKFVNVIILTLETCLSHLDKQLSCFSELHELQVDPYQ